MSPRSDHHDLPTADQPVDGLGRDTAVSASGPHNSASPLTERRSLMGLGSALIGASCLIVAITASTIAWQHFERGPVPVVASVASVSPAEVTSLRRQLAQLESATFALRSELDDLTGPGGVLPRMIEQLQNGKQTDASHAAVLQQLLEANLTQTSNVSIENALAQTWQGRGPVQVSPVRGDLTEQPRMVIVTPLAANPTDQNGQGQ